MHRMLFRRKCHTKAAKLRLASPQTTFLPIWANPFHWVCSALNAGTGSSLYVNGVVSSSRRARKFSSRVEWREEGRFGLLLGPEGSLRKRVRRDALLTAADEPVV